MNIPVDRAEWVAALHDLLLGREPESVQLALGDPDAVQAVIESVLGPVQYEIGLRWQHGQMTTDEVHPAIEAVEAALQRLWDSVAECVAPRGPRVAAVCAPGEWHDVPLRMAALEMRCHGCDVTLLGASMDADAVEQYVRDTTPVAVALSVTVTPRIRPALSVIDAVHRQGVPVIAGGAGFGRDGVRAAALGIEAWARDGTEAARVLRTWERHPPAVSADPPPGRYVIPDEAVRAAIIDAASRTHLRLADPSSDAVAQEERRVGIELDALLAFVETAVLVGDENVLYEGLEWWDSRLVALRVDPSMRQLSVDALVQALPPGRRRSLLLQSRAQVSPADPTDFTYAE